MKKKKKVIVCIVFLWVLILDTAVMIELDYIIELHNQIFYFIKKLIGAMVICLFYPIFKHFENLHKQKTSMRKNY